MSSSQSNMENNERKGILKNVNDATSQPRKSRTRLYIHSTPNIRIVKKSTRFNEENIKNTLHPIDKDYGMQKINEPKTPYHQSKEDQDKVKIDPNILRKKLDIIKESTEKQKHFEDLRRKHYNEFRAAKEMRTLEDDDEDTDR